MEQGLKMPTDFFVLQSKGIGDVGNALKVYFSCNLLKLYYYGLRLTNKHLLGALDPFTTNTTLGGSFGDFYYARGLV
jgi:hypothetical protein